MSRWSGDGIAVQRCCARCRRGVPGFGELPCGYDLKCRCHNDSLGAQSLDNGPGALGDRYDTGTPQTGVQQNEYPRRK